MPAIDFDAVPMMPPALFSPFSLLRDYYQMPMPLPLAICHATPRY